MLSTRQPLLLLLLVLVAAVVAPARALVGTGAVRATRRAARTPSLHTHMHTPRLLPPTAPPPRTPRPRAVVRGRGAEGGGSLRCQRGGAALG